MFSRLYTLVLLVVVVGSSLATFGAIGLIVCVAVFTLA